MAYFHSHVLFYALKCEYLCSSGIYIFPAPIIYQVHRQREGNSFATRRVDAMQQGNVIFTLLASFQAIHSLPCVFYYFLFFFLFSFPRPVLLLLASNYILLSWAECNYWKIIELFQFILLMYLCLQRMLRRNWVLNHLLNLFRFLNFLRFEGQSCLIESTQFSSLGFLNTKCPGLEKFHEGFPAKTQNLGEGSIDVD